MKFFVVLFLITGAFSLPYDKETYRWKIIRDGNNKMHMNDGNADNAEPEPAFDPLNETRFLLFTRQNPTQPQTLTFDPQSLRNSNWNANNGFRFIIHGWQGGPNSNMNVIITRELLANSDLNVVVVDWSRGADTTIYNNARNRVGGVGGAIALFIDTMHVQNLINFPRITLIGHNLGGHVAGFAGKQVTRGRIAAIFANDPSLDGFNPGAPTQRLHVTDAEYTETIHTDSGNQGFDQPITLSAFYPNWGTSQPGCGLIDWNGNCSHERSNLFYTESVNSDRFVARQCSGFLQIQNRNCPGIGTGIMGGDVPKAISGVFFLETNANSPFARG